MTDEARLRQRALWASGDFSDIARMVEDTGEVVVDAADPQPGQDVLDVATGTGNAAIPAAQRGARVTGLDITPELLEAGRARAREADLEIEWIEGMAEALPFADASFHAVTSAFGTMFAPNHRQTAAEMARVCRPGGTIAVIAWTPQGMQGQMFVTMARHMPPPPEGFEPPILWGVEDHMRSLLGDWVEHIRFEHHTTTFEADSPEAFVDYLERALGPIILAKRALEPSGGWDAARADLVKLYEQFNGATDGTLRAESEYLLTVARR
jgi:ubiquinone/menaquinone biosynthesis C-methylase UbiE